MFLALMALRGRRLETDLFHSSGEYGTFSDGFCGELLWSCFAKGAGAALGRQ